VPKSRKPRRVVKGLDRSVPGMFQAALRHHDNGRIDEAVTLYKRILTLKPGSADAHNNLGSALEALDRIDEAVVHFQRALVLDAGHATAHNNLGVALVKQGRIDEAVAHYERALILKPDYAAAHNNLGVALEKQGKIDEALKHYESALVLTPVSPHMLFDRPLVLDAEQWVRLELLGPRPAVLVLDGQSVDVLEPGDAVVCRTGPAAARLVTFGPRDFFSILRARFHLADR